VTEGSVNLYFTTARAAAAAPVQSVSGRTGTITVAQLGTSGTASSTTFLRGDGAWATAGGLGADDDIDGGWFYGNSGLSRSITITSPPTNQTASSGAATFGVTAVAEPSGTLSYQWQKSDAIGFDAVQRTLPTTEDWIAVGYGGGTFVAVATGASTVAATSTDGITWTQRTMPATAQWDSVTYGGGAFVAVAYNTALAATIALSVQTAFANVSGATSSTLALTGLTNAADHLDRFRVVVSAASASSVTSQPATLTVS
jgi:hypothetical protein